MEREIGAEGDTGKKAEEETGKGKRVNTRRETTRHWENTGGKNKGQAGVEETGGETLERLADQIKTEAVEKEVDSQGLELD